MSFKHIIDHINHEDNITHTIGAFMKIVEPIKWNNGELNFSEMAELAELNTQSLTIILALVGYEGLELLDKINDIRKCQFKY